VNTRRNENLELGLLACAQLRDLDVVNLVAVFLQPSYCDIQLLFRD
jgi:hypothetical protein